MITRKGAVHVQYKCSVFSRICSKPGAICWCVPEILAIWEAVIGRVEIQGQHRQNVHKTPSQPTAWCGGTHLSTHTTQEIGNRRTVVPCQPRRRKSS
jgi:hypothetical protein